MANIMCFRVDVASCFVMEICSTNDGQTLRCVSNSLTKCTGACGYLDNVCTYGCGYDDSVCTGGYGYQYSLCADACGYQYNVCTGGCG